jgi:hypothetical protein
MPPDTDTKPLDRAKMAATLREWHHLLKTTPFEEIEAQAIDPVMGQMRRYADELDPPTPTMVLSFHLETWADPSQMLDLLTEAAETLAQDLRDGGERVDFDDGTACVGPVKPPGTTLITIPARDFEEGVPDGGSITFAPWVVADRIGYTVRSRRADGGVAKTQEVWLRPSPGGHSPDVFVEQSEVGSLTGEPDEITFVNVGVDWPEEEGS